MRISDWSSDVCSSDLEGDVEKMRRVFHPCCHLYSAPDGALDDSDLESYLARVASRESPLALKQKRYDAILSIDCTAEGAAFVRLRTARAPRLYTDYLSLLTIDGRWQVVAKPFGWELGRGARWGGGCGYVEI